VVNTFWRSAIWIPTWGLTILNLSFSCFSLVPPDWCVKSTFKEAKTASYQIRANSFFIIILQFLTPYYITSAFGEASSNKSVVYNPALNLYGATEGHNEHDLCSLIFEPFTFWVHQGQYHKRFRHQEEDYDVSQCFTLNWREHYSFSHFRQTFCLHWYWCLLSVYPSSVNDNVNLAMHSELGRIC